MWNRGLEDEVVEGLVPSERGAVTDLYTRSFTQWLYSRFSLLSFVCLGLFWPCIQADQKKMDRQGVLSNCSQVGGVILVLLT